MEIIIWLSFFFIIGTLNLPLTRYLLPGLRDRGWIFSKILAILIISYTAWLGGITNILSFSMFSITLITILLFIANIYINKKNKTAWIDKHMSRLLIIEEAIFIISFLFWTYVRSYNPDIHNLEKYMDFGFINSILRSEYFPPKDMWLSGGTINYYYFGHLLTATVIKILSTKPEIGYNLMLSLLFSLTFSGSFSIGYNLITFKYREFTKLLIPILGGLITAVILTVLGNLQVIFAFYKGFSSYWYPDATRFIPNTIHEFPIYSFVVADLHGHLLNIPTVLLIIIFYFSNLFARNENASTEEKNSRSRVSFKYRSLIKYLLPGFLLAISYMTNAADSIIYFGLFLLSLLFINFFLLKRGGYFNLLLNLLVPSLLALSSFFIFSLPFQITFTPFTEGIGLTQEKSSFWMLLILWGFSAFFSLSFLASYLSNISKKEIPDKFIALLSIFSFVLVLIPEVIYFRDIYTGQPRANTMFKFTYQAFIMFSIVSGYAILTLVKKVLEKTTFLNLLWTIVAANLLVIMSFYPYFAIKSAYGKVFSDTPKGLDGTKYLSLLNPGDYDAIRWINLNIQGQPVIVEAVGESYTNYARISANTGLPTILGWPVHEWLWRKNVKITEIRRFAVEMIYTENDPNVVKKILNDYHAEYIYIGGLERERYPSINITLLESLGDKVYENRQSEIIKIGNQI